MKDRETTRGKLQHDSLRAAKAILPKVGGGECFDRHLCNPGATDYWPWCAQSCLCCPFTEYGIRVCNSYKAEDPCSACAKEDFACKGWEECFQCVLSCIIDLNSTCSAVARAFFLCLFLLTRRTSTYYCSYYYCGTRQQPPRNLITYLLSYKYHYFVCFDAIVYLPTTTVVPQ
jgi:hypothetical protein